MNGERIFELLGNIDDCWILEAQEPTTASEVSALEPTMKERLRSFYASGWPVAIAAVLLMTMGIGVILKGTLRNKDPETGVSVETHATEETHVMVSQVNETGAGPNGVTEAGPGVFDSTPDGGTETDPKSGGAGMIPKIPEDRTIVLTGDLITDEEAAVYFESEMRFICEGLRAMGVSLTDPHVSSTGYCYVQYGGYEGEGLTVHQNFRDYLLYDGEELVSIVTLFRIQGEDGRIHNSPAFGGEWMKGYGEWLAEHKGQELLFVRAGDAEFILAPNGDYTNPAGMEKEEIDQYFEGIAYPYEIFYCEAATYTP
ncbi:MAG: hypothetical protein IK020_10630 [Clostridiales bacterium]|nr:hypothetical protein [Clostridiales bacterium]